MTFTRALSTNNYGTAKFIVDGSVTANGTHSTIQAAIDAASAGDTIFIRPKTSGAAYTENLTLKAGVNLCAYDCDATTPNVTILGKCTFTAAGTVSISGIQLKTNSDFFLAVTGSAASIVNLIDCYLNVNNNTGITYTTSSSSAIIKIINCQGDTGATGITYWVSTSAGYVIVYNSYLENHLLSTTASSNSAGVLLMNNSRVLVPLSTSSTGVFQAFGCTLSPGTNTTAITHNGSASNSYCLNSYVESGTASAVSIGSGSSLEVSGCIVNSTNTNAITGAGTLTTKGNFFANPSYTINTTTLVTGVLNTGGIVFSATGSTSNVLSTYLEGTWTATWTGASTAGSTSYSNQNGYYTKIGIQVLCQFTLVVNSATGTGNIVVGGLPFTIKNQTRGDIVGAVWLNNAITWPASRTACVLYSASNSTTLTIQGMGTGQSGSAFQMSNNGQTCVGNVTYQV